VAGRILRIALWLVSALTVAGYVVLAASGLGNPRPSDPLEIAILEHATRLAQGQPLYLDSSAAPTTELMPGFPFVVSGLIRMFEPGLWEARLLDLLVTLLAAGLVMVIVRVETRSATLGVASCGLLLLGEALAKGGPASGHPESLMLFLVLAGCALLRYGPGIPWALAASLVLAAGCFTHPAGLWFAFAALFHLAVHDKRRLVAYAAGLVAFVGGGQVALSIGLGPWFDFYAWNVPLQALRFEPAGLVHYLGTQILGTLGVLTLGAVLSFALPVAPWRGAVGIWTWMLLAALGAGIAATQSETDAANALRVVAVMLAVAGPVSIQRVTQHLATWPGSTRLGGQSLVLTAVVLQFLTLAAHMTPAMLRVAG
jgi:hypothetical protein